MDFNQLKTLAKKLGGILVMNGNVPEFVVLSFEDFQKMQGESEIEEQANPADDEGAIEKLNKEISALKEEIRQKEEAELDEEPAHGEEDIIEEETGEEEDDSEGQAQE
jgi:PHD/YefM family antitoxin component YafN of YafNO toxin-antitoxin module